ILPRGPEGSVMQTLRVRDVMHDEIVTVRHTAPFAEVVDHFLRQPYNNLYVVNDDGVFLGAIRLHAVKGALHDAGSLPTVIARDLMDDTFPCLVPDQPLAETMEVFWREPAERLPVVEPKTRRLIGWVAKRDLFGVYSQEILRKRQLLGRFVLKDTEGERDLFVELPEGFQVVTLTVPPAAAGQTIRQLAIRSRYNVHVLQLKRLDPQTGRVLIEAPTPDSRLDEGVQMTLIGPADGLAEFQRQLYATDANEPANH
ncbi:MAG: CBS domain-containing protein, partial [Verrucomicrobiae bacterium]|nr:CBS domain-containing protein [Verrucomicrobiae bacterium]